MINHFNIEALWIQNQSLKKSIHIQAQNRPPKKAALRLIEPKVIDILTKQNATRLFCCMGGSTSKTCQINFNHIFQISSLSKIDVRFFCSQNPCLYFGLLFKIGYCNSFYQQTKHFQTKKHKKIGTEKLSEEMLCCRWNKCKILKLKSLDR